jgi:ubiquinone/menaquinone biosynthesis C-methylase UbiE
MTQLPNAQTFTAAYSGEAPWDIGRPQPSFIAIADQVVSPVLDVGCGTGDSACYFAERGHQVTGFDFLEEPIRRARAKAAERGLTVDFRVSDALALVGSDERFNTIFDSGLFHVFSDEDRRRYVAGLAHVLNPGGRLYLQCFSDAEPVGAGPRRITRDALNVAFANGWEIESVQPVQFELNPKFTGATFSAGGPHSWFAVLRRV